MLPTLRRQHEHGAIAAKFELAYLRSLAISNPTKAEAAAVYAKYIDTNTSPDPAAYKPLQDYLFRTIALECGRLGMAVHFHSMAGAGSYFSIAGGNPMNMEPCSTTPPCATPTSSCCTAAGPSCTRPARCSKSQMSISTSRNRRSSFQRTRSPPGCASGSSYSPTRFSSPPTATPTRPYLGWEESTWLSARNARQALGIALTGMERDGEITPARASQIAHMVLHDNAAALYHLPQPQP